jgi:hypothetical protein
LPPIFLEASSFQEGVGTHQVVASIA